MKMKIYRVEQAETVSYGNLVMKYIVQAVDEAEAISKCRKWFAEEVDAYRYDFKYHVEEVKLDSLPLELRHLDKLLEEIELSNPFLYYEN